MEEGRAISPRDFLDSLVDMLDYVSSSVPLPLTGFREKWRIVSEILLGHPRVRGGARPRDYPMGRIRSLSSNIGATLCTTWVKNTSLKVDLEYTLYDFVAALQAVSVSRLEAPAGVAPEDTVQQFGGLVVGCLQRIFKTFAGGAKAALPYVTEVLERLGFSKNELRLAGFKEESGHFSPSLQIITRKFVWAELAAALSRLSLDCSLRAKTGPEFLKAGFEEKKQILLGRLASHGVDNFRELEAQSFTLVRLKARHVQALLAKCRTHSVQRGASAWCSQATARWRDHLLESFGDESSLSVACDADAGVVLIAPPDFSGPRLLRESRALFSSPNYRTVALAGRYPKLRRYLVQARKERLWTADLDPSLEARLDRTNLLRYSIEGALHFKDHKEGPAFLELPSTSPSPSPKRRRCDGIDGHRHFKGTEFNVPEWWQGMDAGGHREAYGPVAIAYSLAGSNYAQITGEGIRDELLATFPSLSKDGPSGIRVVRKEKELLSRLGLEDDSMVLVRVDGDRVGKVFVEAPQVTRPGLSLCLEHDLRHKWLKAIGTLMLEKSFDTVPVTLIYFGGDDLQFRVPGSCLDALVAHLTHQGSSKLPGVPAVCYTIAAFPIRWPDQPADGPAHAGAHNVVSKLMEIAKSGVRDPETASLALQGQNSELPPINLLRIRPVEGSDSWRGLLGSFASGPAAP